MDKLVLKKNGKLIKTQWIYDEEKKEGSYVDKDVTDSSINHLQDRCELDSDITLNDVFLLLDSELEIYDLLLKNWTKEIVQEGLFKIADEKETEIEYLELYRHAEYTKYEKDEPLTLEGISRPDFHGIGFELTEDSKEGFEKGTRVPYSLSFQKSYNLAQLPVKLNYKMDVYKNDYDLKEYSKVPFATYEYVPFTLFDILYGIMWELSFYGPPEKRDKKGEEILGIVNDFKLSVEKR